MGCFGCFGTTRKEVGDGSDFYSGHFDKNSAAEQVMADVVKSDAQTKEAPEMVPTNMSIVQSTANVEDPAASVIQAQIFTLQELTTAANDFSPDCLIGEGGFGPVYKGRLQNGQVVAIKQLNQKGFQGNREFLVEVLMLSLLHHENLVNLIGYCAEGDQRLLVYEYMPLGSLEDRLHDLPTEREPLDWTARMKIAAGAARGLEYLHDVAFPPVIYRDLKSSNILLGEDFYPKLSDFGLAKLGPVGDKTHVSTRVMGTYGYCAPEYAMTGQLTVKSDVYSFGVLLLELITGRRPIDPLRPHGEQKLVAWARPLFKDRRKFSQMADLNLRGHFPVRGLFQALAVAAMCLHEQAASRPAIADVVTALNFLAFQSCGPTSQVPSTTSMVPLDSAPEEVKTGATLLYTAEAGQPAVASSDENAATSLAGWADMVSEKGSRAVERAGKDRQQAVAEARLWVESLREKRGEVVAQGKGS